MPTHIDVFADIACPFTHVGLNLVTRQLDEIGIDAVLVVRAWPLEWVNGHPLEAGPVGERIAALRSQLSIDLFSGFNPAEWPDTTIPALNLASDAYEVDAATGLAVSLQLRQVLFEGGANIANLEVLTAIASGHGLPTPSPEPGQSIEADYAEGKRRGVRGSPDFWVGGEHFFCPSLQLGWDDDGDLSAEFDHGGLSEFVAKVTA